MIKNIWHSVLILGFIGFCAYVLASTNDCERVDRAVSPIRGVAHSVSWVSRHWLEQTDTAGIEEAGAEAARYVARAGSQTFLGSGVCSFPDPAPVRAIQSPQFIPADAAAQAAPILVPTQPATATAMPQPPVLQPPALQPAK